MVQCSLFGDSRISNTTEKIQISQESQEMVLLSFQCPSMQCPDPSPCPVFKEVCLETKCANTNACMCACLCVCMWCVCMCACVCACVCVCARVCAAPGPPSSLQFESPSETELSLHWRPPLQPNGILTGYLLEYHPCTYTSTLH